jgi:4-aminobutyrate aminotransferase-like enzyme
VPARRRAGLAADSALDLLAAFESRNITFRAADGSWPIVWERARGCTVWDIEGRRYIDLTAAFGVAAAGHCNAGVVAAGRRQMGRLLHAMGDVHPHRLKALLARELSRLTFERWTNRRRGMRRAAGKTVFCNSGFEAVEVALKTAALATRKPRVIAFSGAYHGLGYGALNVTHRAHFRSAFLSQLREFGEFLPYPDTAQAVGLVLRELRHRLTAGGIGAVLFEPIQGRGGIRVPPAGFVAALRKLTQDTGTVLIADEVFTGFGRTGRWFAVEHDAVVPDLVCLGKALAGGFPIAACVGRAELMDAAWPAATGEAIHTSTFLGHPVGCAMALAQIREIRRRGLVRRSAVLGRHLRAELARVSAPARLSLEVRGKGLMAGVACARADGASAGPLVMRVVQGMLDRGWICLPEGEQGEVLSFTPPLTIAWADLARAVEAFAETLQVAAKG